MGRRLAVLNALTGTPDPTLPPPPRVIVAPVRAILQRLGPLEGTAPIVIRPGQQVDVGELLPELVAMGYRREHQVEHRGEFAVRGGIVDVFPSTADVPVRIDLWGDEVDRLTAFSVSDQRSSHDLRAVALYGCRELVVTPALRDAASALVSRRPWGASVWENLAEGTQFDGMESWLPFLDDTVRVLPDLLPDGAQVVLVEPRRIRDRGVQLLDEEAALAETLAATWGAKEVDEESFPRLHVPFERLLSESAAGVTALPPVPEGPDMAALTVRRFDPVAGDPARLAAGVTGLMGQGYSVALCAATAAGARRLSAALAAEGVHAPVLTAAPGTPGACVVAAPITSGFILPEAKVAVLSETDVTGRRVPHRRARPRARAADGFFDDLEAGSFVVHRQHGVARFEGVTTRTMGGRPAITSSCSTGGRTVSTSRSSRSRPSRPTAVASPRRSRRWAVRTGRRPEPRRAPPPARWRRSWSSCTAAAWLSRGGRSAPTRRGRRRWRPPSASSRRRTSSRRSPT